MCDRFSRPKKIGKRSSASLFFYPESLLLVTVTCPNV